MYANAALSDPFKEEGAQNGASGGPNWNVIDIWKAAAPHIALVAPDIYDRDLKVYAHSSTITRGPTSPVRSGERQRARIFALPLARARQGRDRLVAVRHGRDRLFQFPARREAARRGDDRSLRVEVSLARADRARLGEARLRASRPSASPRPHDGADQSRRSAAGRSPRCTACGSSASATGPGSRCRRTPTRTSRSAALRSSSSGPTNSSSPARTSASASRSTTPPPGDNVQFLDVEEGTFDNGRWVMQRRWNGDQTDYGLNLTSPVLLKVAHGDLSMKFAATFALLASRRARRRSRRPVKRTPSGIIVSPAASTEKAVRLEVYGDGIIRVTSTPDAEVEPPQSLMVTRRPLSTRLHRRRNARRGDASDAQASAVRRACNRKRQLPQCGRPSRARRKRTAHVRSGDRGRRAVRCRSRQQFNRGTDEGFYGLGQHQNRQMNYNGEDVELAQHNMDVAVPFVRVDAQLRPAVGQQFDHPLRRSQALRAAAGATTVGWTPPTAPTARRIADRAEPAIDSNISRTGRTGRRARARPTGGETVPGPKVIWTGTYHASAGGLHTFRLYSSSYVKVFVDGRRSAQPLAAELEPLVPQFRRSSLPHGQAARAPRRMGAERRLYRALPHRPAARRRPPFADASPRSSARASIITSSAAPAWTTSSPAIAS